MYEYRLTTRFDDIDHAGRVFYAKAFEYVQEAEEHWFEDLGYSMWEQETELGILLPIVDAHAEYTEPMRLEDRILIELSISELSEKAFTVDANAFHSGQDIFSVRLVRVCMDSDSERATEIPDQFREALEPHVS